MDFAKIDTFVRDDIHKEIYQTYAKGIRKNISLDDVPFGNYIDLWMLGFCVAIKNNLKPIEKDYKGARAFQGQVFVDNEIIESIIKLVVIDQSNNEELLLDPNKIHKHANDLSLAGMSYIREFMTKDSDESNLDNLLNSVKELIAKNK